MSGITIYAYAIGIFLWVTPSEMFDWILNRPQAGGDYNISTSEMTF